MTENGLQKPPSVKDVQLCQEQTFDVFCSYNRIDGPTVETILRRLKRYGIQPWVDFWELRPGSCWQYALEKQIRVMRCAAVFVGKNGLGPWHSLEQTTLLREFIERDCPVIPVILPDSRLDPKLPIFLKALTWVDFRQRTHPDPIELLAWGILGQRPAHRRARKRK